MSEATPGTGVAGAATIEPGTSRPRRRRRKRSGGLRDMRSVTGADKVAITLMWLVPTILVVGLVWLPALASVALSFARWEGLGGLDTIEWIGVENYVNVFTNYPPFWPAIQNNVVLLVFLFLVPTVFGIFLAVLIDRELRGSRFYQTSYFLPVVLSLALTGFIWQLLYSKDQGLINAVLNTDVDWYGDPNVNFYAVLVAVGWKQAGYIMLIYLAGLKGVDPSLREAAKVDGATEWQTFFRVVFPVMLPINIIVLVITVIDSLRLFDLVWVINKGRNGLELISALVTQNIIGEASRIGFGSAMATIMLVISTIFIIVYLRVIREDLK
jgi:multiple sugar transport system permease protein